jgi:epoxyqueuosine reductase
MYPDAALTLEIVAKAESLKEGVCAGIVRLVDVLQGPSYRAVQDGPGRTNLFGGEVQVDWPANALSVLVLGLLHPPQDPRLDWWERGETLGNRHLRRASQTLKRWLLKELGLNAVPLPYHIEKGGLFLKDAAVLAGLGVIGRNNLVIHPQWGPRVRWRAVLVKEALHPTNALQDFSPCTDCDGFCHKACPVAAFAPGRYRRPVCLGQMKKDEAQSGRQMSEPDFHGRRYAIIKYCRACELACPVGT